MKHWAEYETDDPAEGWDAAVEEAERAYAAEAERDRLRAAITEALAVMKQPDRTNGECLSAAHSILSCVMADEPKPYSQVRA